MISAKLATRLSIILLIAALATAVVRHFAVSTRNMIHFDSRLVMLGGEDHPVLEVLRNKDPLTPLDIQALLPPRQTYTPQQPVYFSRHEVTNSQYKRFLSQGMIDSNSIQAFAHPSIEPDHKFKPTSINDVKYSNNRQPIVNVSWHDAYAFCRFINMRLPTAAEFEAAMQVEAALRQPNEFDNPLKSVVSEIVPIEVGKYHSAHGIFQELIGNVMEWVQPLGDQHLLMGYSYKQYDRNNTGLAFHPWKRQFASPEATANDFGFRCVYQPPISQTLEMKSLPTVDHDRVKCWHTQSNLGQNGFDLTNPSNQRFADGGLFPDQLCQLPVKTYQLGPDQALTSVDLIQQKPLGFAHYLLGNSPKQQQLSAYWLDKSEVSIGDYTEFLTISAAKQQRVAHPEQPQHHDRTPALWAEQQQRAPEQAVTGISWWDAFAYCSWQHKRLPFSSEWESAAQSNDGRAYAWGNDTEQNITPDQTPQGIKNLTRIVSEWTATFVPGTDTALVKGGSERFDWKVFGRAYVELKISRDTRSPAIGFRCARGA